MGNIAGLFIVIYERLGFLVVNLDSVSSCFLVIIFSLNQFCSADIAYAFLLWRDVYNVE